MAGVQTQLTEGRTRTIAKGIVGGVTFGAVIVATVWLRDEWEAFAPWWAQWMVWFAVVGAFLGWVWSWDGGR